MAPSELRLDSAYVIRGTIRRLEQLVGSNSGAVISLELAVTENSSDRLVLSKVYTAPARPDRSGPRWPGQGHRHTHRSGDRPTNRRRHERTSSS